MIEHQTINGRPVTIGYLDAGFSPADKNAAELVKLSFDDGETTFLSTKSPAEHAGDAEAVAWNAYRERHRAPLVAPQPEVSPARRTAHDVHDDAIRGFSVAMREADKYRSVLRGRFGYKDSQIGTLAVAALRHPRLKPYRELAKAVLRAKRRLTSS